ncbi:MAG: rhodanese-like domain-containing protein [Pseudomonadota bacterium]
MRRTIGALALVCSLLLPVCDLRADDIGNMTAATLWSRLASAEAPLLLDVRTREEFAAGHLPGARNIPHTELADALPALGADPAREVVVYCVAGIRADKALAVLQAHGFAHLWHLTGNYAAWLAEGRPIEGVDAPIAR